MSQIGLDGCVAAEIDLDRYFARIGYDGPREPTIEVLRALHRLHPAAIPFEAIDVLLAREIGLGPATLQAKMIAGGRGGYCFEQNGLFKLALQAIGFEVASLIARSRWGRPLGDIRARTHMALRVRIDGEDWLADVGYSSAMLTAPIRLAERGPQETLHEPVRLRPVDGELRLEVLIVGEWRPIYDAVPRPQHDADLAAANWFVSTWPASPFRHALIVSRTTPQARYVLHENRLTIRRPGRESERLRLSADEMTRLLGRDFGLAVEPAWRPVLEAAVTRGDDMERRG
jgi:N-hydroxyarylamine O-acetyltransferase